MRGVVLEHAFGGEVGAVETDAGAHDLGPIGLVVSEGWQDFGFEFVVEAGDVLAFGLAVDGPAGDVLDVAFDPPAVEGAE